jgi:hypothetical protein
VLDLLHIQHVFFFNSGFKSLLTDPRVLDTLKLEQAVELTGTMTCSCLVESMYELSVLCTNLNITRALPVHVCKCDNSNELVFSLVSNLRVSLY